MAETLMGGHPCQMDTSNCIRPKGREAAFGGFTLDRSPPMHPRGPPLIEVSQHEASGMVLYGVTLCM